MALARPHPRMVNLTTASLEPAPLSSGWKSGSLPTGFTPTILREPGRAAATPPASKLKEKTGRGWGKGLEGRGLNGGGSDRGGFFPGRSVPSHARERKGRGGGDGRGEGRGAGGGRCEAPSSHRALGRLRMRTFASFPRSPFWLPPPNPETRTVVPRSTEEPRASGAAQAQTSSGHTQVRVQLKCSCIPPPL